MKKYLLLGEIVGIGGWQLYNDARVCIKTEEGYDVSMLSVIPAEETEIKLEHLKRCRAVFNRAMQRNPWCYPEKIERAIVQLVLQNIDYTKDDEVFVESTAMNYAYWGEEFARATKGIHFSFLLHSHIENVPQEVVPFYDFKLEQGLLAGMSRNTLPELFAGYRCITPEQVHAIGATWNSPLSDDDSYVEVMKQIQSEIGNQGKVIGYFGTLNKPHFVLLCQAIKRYIHAHAGTKFVFLSIGSSFDGKAENEQKKVEQETPNCVCVNIPEMYPVPQSLFQIMNVCIGSWGSALTAAKAGTLTIRMIDDVGIKPQGIIGITLNTAPYYLCSACSESLDELLDKILFEKFYTKEMMIEPPSDVDFHISHHEQDEYIKSVMVENKAHTYYDVLSIPCRKMKEKIRKMLFAILGYNITDFLLVSLKRQKNAWAQISNITMKKWLFGRMCG